MRRREFFLLFNWIFTQNSDKSDILELKKSDKSGKVGQIFKKSEKLAKSDNYEACSRYQRAISNFSDANSDASN